MSDTDERRMRRLHIRALLIVLAVLTLLLMGGYVLWEFHTRRDLGQALAAWRDAGDPIEENDFVRPPLPDELNAAAVLRRAQEHFNDANDPLSMEEFTGRLPLSPQHMEVVAKYLQQNAAALVDLRAARKLSQAQWNVAPNLWITLKDVPQFKQQRELANLAGLAAPYYTQRGDEAQAVEAIRDVLHQGDIVGQITPTLVCSLISLGLRGLATARVEQLATADFRPTTRPASPEQLHALITELLDGSAQQRQWKTAMKGERAIELHWGRQFVPKCLPPAAGRQHLLRMLRETTDLIEIGAMNTWPQANAALKQLDRPPPKLKTTISLMNDVLRPSLTRSVETQFRLTTQRRLAALALAIRWYRAEHNGTFPPTLAALMPQYLTTLPADPYAADGKTFGYLPAAPKPRLYSVGENGADDGGSLTLLPRERERDYFHQWAYLDPPMFLTADGWTPPPAGDGDR